MNIIADLKKSTAGIAVMLLLLSGCTASKHSSRELAEARNAMEEIEQLEAPEYSQDEYQEAQARFEEAQQLAEKGKHKKAALKAREAQLVAELAEMKTLTQKTDESISELNASIQSLKNRLARYRQGSQNEDPNED